MPKEPFAYRDTALIVLLVLLFSIVAVLISDWNASRGIFDYHEKSPDQKQRAIAKYCADVQAAFIDGALRSEPNDPNNASKPDKQSYDSCQQWRSAEFTEKAAYYAQWQGIAAAVGLPFLLMTLLAAWRAAHWAKAAAFHTKDAAKAAQDSSRLDDLTLAEMQVTAKRQLRAYVCVEKSTVLNLKPNGTPRIVVETKNTGQTPAYDVKMIIGVGIGKIYA